MWAAIIAAVAAIITMIVQGSQNKNLAEYQADRNEGYLSQQQQYNSPTAQMLRLKEAGLNPMLALQGGATGGSQSQPLQFPNIQPVDIVGGGRTIGNSAMMALQARLTKAQTEGLEAKTIESQAKAGLIEIQKEIAKKNPYLNEAAYKAMVDSFISNAQIKASVATIEGQRADFMTEKNWHQTGPNEVTRMSNGYAKMQKELELLDQKFNLGAVDQKIKAQILESKEFQNQILEVQKRFMTDGDLTPQHIVAFIQLLLMKLASR